MSDEIHTLTPCQISGHRFQDGFCPDCGETEVTEEEGDERADNGRNTGGKSYYRPRFNEHDCGGVFDGNGVVSDADPGL